MNITLNGEITTITATNIAELLTEIQSPPRGIAVEVNQSIIPKSEHASYLLHENDIVEIVGFIGGG